MLRLFVLALCLVAGFTAVAQDLLTSLPQCGQTCTIDAYSNATSFGCSDTDRDCLEYMCTNAKYGKALRDCVNESCPASVIAQVMSVGTTWCVPTGASAGLNNSSTPISGSATGSGKASTAASSTLSDETVSTILRTTKSTSEAPKPPSSAASSSATSSSSANNQTQSPSSGLSTGAKIGIGIGVPVAVFIIAAGSYLILRRRRKASRGRAVDGASAHPDAAEKDGNPRSELEADYKQRIERAELEANEAKGKDLAEAVELKG